MLQDGFTLENKDDGHGKDYRGEFMNPPVSRGTSLTGIIPVYKRCRVQVDRLVAGNAFLSPRSFKIYFCWETPSSQNSRTPQTFLMRPLGMMISVEHAGPGGSTGEAACEPALPLEGAVGRPVSRQGVLGAKFYALHFPWPPSFLHRLLTLAIPFTNGFFHLFWGSGV